MLSPPKMAEGHAAAAAAAASRKRAGCEIDVAQNLGLGTKLICKARGNRSYLVSRITLGK